MTEPDIARTDTKMAEGGLLITVTYRSGEIAEYKLLDEDGALVSRTDSDWKPINLADVPASVQTILQHQTDYIASHRSAVGDNRHVGP